MASRIAAAVLSVVSSVTGFGDGQAIPSAGAGPGAAGSAPRPTSLFEFKATALDGSPVDLGSMAGKVVLVVNVASRCGYTAQYADLEKLWKEYRDRGLVVVGFPCNDFGGQEPGSEKEIGDFCRANFGVSFPMMSKVQTKPGKEQSPIYSFLGGATKTLPSWNFGKYLVGRDGVPIAFYGSGTKPMGDELRAAVERALAAKAPETKPAAPAKPADGTPGAQAPSDGSAPKR
jgi:glutathione peroxidase